MNKSKRIRQFLFLQIIFAWYSCVGIFSKHAAEYSFLSINYLKWYAGVIIVMGVYAILWQQALKRLPLNIAYSSRAVVPIWSMIWGILFWNEKISIGKIFAIFVIVVGVFLVLMIPSDKIEIK